MIPVLLCVVVFFLSVSDALLGPGGARRLVRSPHRSAIRQWASAADGAASEDSDGKRKKKNDTDDVDDEMRKKLPRAMIKPSNDDDNSTPSGPPQDFDSGISGRNSKASAARQQRALLADLNAAARAAAGDKAASIERNWKYGLCRHHVVFKATEVVKRIRFKGDVMALAFTDGKVALVNMTTTDIIRRYREHADEVSALDFDGQRAVSAGMDGTVNVYTLAGSSTGSGSGSGSGEEGAEKRRRGQPRAFAKSALKFSDAAVLAQQQEEEAQDQAQGGSRGGESPPGATATAPRPTAQAGQQQQHQQLVFESLHTKRVTGARLLPSAPNTVVGGGAAAPAPLMVTCGLDKRLRCVDVATGAVQYTVTLDSAPVCMDVDAQSGSYVAVGLLDGRVQFYSARRGTKVMEFQAHPKKVQSLHMLSPSVVVTGGADGVIRRWDLSGEGKKREEEIKQRVADTPQAAAAAVAAAAVPAVAEAAVPAARMRFLDYYFSEAIDARAAAAGSTSIVPVVGQSRASVPTATASSATKAAAPAKEAAPAGKASRVADRLAQLTEAVDTYADPERTAPVIALQGDAQKILAAYADGRVQCWDVATGESQYEVHGRSAQVTSLQFDATRLLVDGTHTAVVLHDYSEAPATDEPVDLEFQVQGGDEDDFGDGDGFYEVDEEDDGEDGEEGESDDGEDGIPSSTT